MKGAADRFLHDETFYLDCLVQALNDVNFEYLGNALKQKQTNTAFDAAHSLKGVIGNMGLTPLYQPLIEIVEILRKGSLVGTSELYQKILIERNRFLKYI